MTTIATYSSCSTAGVRLLDQQLIAQIQSITPGVLVKFDHLPVLVGTGCHPYLQARAVSALERAIALRGVKMKINSAYRTLAQQAVLYAHYQMKRCGIRAAAKPGASNHNTGLAIDIEDASGWRPYLEKCGWDWIGSFDPMHFDYVGSGCCDMKHLSILAFQQLYNRNNPRRAISCDGVWGESTQQALMQTLVTGFGLASSLSSSSPPRLSSVESSDTKRISALRWGDKGLRVTQLQQMLQQHDIQLVVDGDFGKATLDAVKSFQRQQGLVDDGVVGVATLSALGIRGATA